jgi:RND family efflux transporter MFP subunit
MSSPVFRPVLWVTLLVIMAGAALAAVLQSRSVASSPQEAPATQAVHAPRQLWHCGMHPQVVQDHPGDCPICHMALTPFTPSESKSTETSGAAVTIDPAVVQNMGIRTAKVTRGTLTKTVRTVGLLSLPEPGMHDVSLKVGGWIDKLDADQEGMHVREGDPLFEVYSPDLQVAEQELISAVKSKKALGSDASPALHQESQTLIDSAKRKLRLWDVDERDIEAIARADQPPRDVTFRSPATGHVEEKMVVQGSTVQPGMKLLRIADHTRLWLDVQVYEEQLPFVKIGQKVVATVDGISGKTFTGTITFMYPHLDASSRTVKARATLDNPEFELKPGMYATADIVTQPVSDAILCPREAVIDTGTRQIAFVAEGDGHFSPRNIRVGLSGDDDQVQIVEGLAPGETVVTSGQFLMDVESRTIEATRKLTTGANP